MLENEYGIADERLQVFRVLSSVPQALLCLWIVVGNLILKPCQNSFSNDTVVLVPVNENGALNNTSCSFDASILSITRLSIPFY